MENSVLIAGLAFVAIFGGSLAGIWLSTRLPQPHLTSESRTAISVSMAVVGTLSALVLSLLISNASTSFNTRTLATEGLAVDLVKLDHALARYGGEAVGAGCALDAGRDCGSQHSARGSCGADLVVDVAVRQLRPFRAEEPDGGDGSASMCPGDLGRHLHDHGTRLPEQQPGAAIGGDG